LYDLKTQIVVWSGMAETTAPGNIQKESAAYAKLMVDALRKKHLV
jgi:hypothetical protein